MLKLSHRRDLTTGPAGSLLASLAGHVFRVGQRAARSFQKGDLPSSGERAILIRSKVADALSSYIGARPARLLGVRVPRPGLWGDCDGSLRTHDDGKQRV